AVVAAIVCALIRGALTLLVVVTAAAAALAPAVIRGQAAASLQIHFVDVEGGQATLLALPSGDALLVDTGWTGFGDRDADRLAAAAKKQGVSRIDTLVITHYHIDHVGGVPALAARLPIRRLVDPGPAAET